MPVHSITPSITPSITTARAGASVDTSQRIRRYTVTMAFRTACFLAAVTLAHGWLQWALMAGAVFLPYMGVLLANQANEKGLRQPALALVTDAPQLTSAPEPEYVEGVVIADDDDPFASAARG